MRFGPANGPQRSNGIFINFLRKFEDDGDAKRSRVISRERERERERECSRVSSPSSDESSSSIECSRVSPIRSMLHPSLWPNIAAGTERDYIEMQRE